MGKYLTTEEFVIKARLIHGDKYDYSKVEYIDTSTKVQIICSVHGDFEQTPKDHLKGRGCSKCGHLLTSKAKTKSLEKLIEQFVEVHGNTYDYSNVHYIADDIKILISCPIHGDFEQQPSAHLQGQGCAECGILKRSRGRVYPFSKFVEKAEAVHGSKFTYSEQLYIKYSVPAGILCNSCNLLFYTTPIHHVREGTGCPNCVGRGFDKTKSAYLYYLKVTTDSGKVLYKIGITNKSVNERFQLKDLQKIEIVKQKLYTSGIDALNWETKLKRLYKQYQYKGPNVLESGNTELFTEDIIALFYKENNL